nr:retrovirus-related Pol polyprotein from transposon TNT 1-94 [Tanacetum cinerariifolium]
CDEINTAKVALMANLSHYGSDDRAESNIVNQSETKITCDSNIIPYSHHRSVSPLNWLYCDSSIINGSLLLKTAMVIHTAKTEMMKLVVEIKCVGMNANAFDKETGSSDGLQLEQVDLNCVHALNQPHLHEIQFCPNSGALTFEDVMATLNSKKIKEMSKAKGDDGERLYVRGRTDHRDSHQSTRKSRSKSQEALLDLTMDSVRSYHMTPKLDILFNFLECDGGSVLLGDNRECKIRDIGKVMVQLRDGSSLVLRNARPTQVEVPKELPKVSMVNTSLKKLKHHHASFDVVVKERTTATAITEGT